MPLFANSANGELQTLDETQCCRMVHNLRSPNIHPDLQASSNLLNSKSTSNAGTGKLFEVEWGTRRNYM